jgi:hypothetical protein
MAHLSVVSRDPHTSTVLIFHAHGFFLTERRCAYCISFRPRLLPVQRFRALMSEPRNLPRCPPSQADAASPFVGRNKILPLQRLKYERWDLKSRMLASNGASICRAQFVDTDGDFWLHLHTTWTPLHFSRETDGWSRRKSTK